MAVQELSLRLQCTIPEENFRPAFEAVKNDPTVPYWMEAEFLDKTHEALECFPSYLEKMKQAQKAVRENADLLCYAKMLEYQFRQEGNLRVACQGLTFPKAPEGADPLGYDTVAIFPLAAHMEKAYRELLGRGIYKEILKTTYCALENSISGSISRSGRFSLLQMYLNWLLHYIRGEILRFERFNFELAKGADLFNHVDSFVNDRGEVRYLMKKWTDKSGQLFGSAGCKDEKNVIKPQVLETEAYVEGNMVDPATWLVEMHTTRLNKKEWKPFLLPEDTVIKIHIPADGSFDKEACQKTFENARAFYKKHFPEKTFKAFSCRSWLMSRELKQILKPTSNILAFQDQFYGFPVTADGAGVFTFVFNKAAPKLEDVDFDSLPEETSLQRGVKQLYQNGGYLYEYGGMFPF